MGDVRNERFFIATGDPAYKLIGEARNMAAVYVLDSFRTCHFVFDLD